MALWAEKIGEQIMLRDNGTVKYGIAFGNDRWYFPDKKEPGTGGIGGGSGGVRITAEMILASCRAAGGTAVGMVATPDAIAASFNEAIDSCSPGVLSSKARAAVLIGQCAEESGWFKTTSEYGGPGLSYAPYYGRGYIQCTHPGNYKAFGQWAEKKGLVTDPNVFYNNPDLLADIKYAPHTALWYFENKYAQGTLWEYCDLYGSPWSQVSRAINRGSPSSPYAANHEAERTRAINDTLAVTPEPTTPGGTGGVAGQVIDLLKTKIGAFKYSQSGGRLQPEQYGYTDCSGLMYWAFLKITGKSIGTYTGNQYPNGTLIKSGSRQANEDRLQPGDLLFCDWGGYNPTFDHVEMYIGNGQILGHGGPGNGPTIYNMSPRMQSMTRWEFRRYV